MAWAKKIAAGLVALEVNDFVDEWTARYPQLEELIVIGWNLEIPGAPAAYTPAELNKEWTTAKELLRSLEQAIEQDTQKPDSLGPQKS